MMSLSGFQPYELNLLSRDTVDGIAESLTVLPQSGDIVISAFQPPKISCSLYVFSLENGKLNKKKKIYLSCNHNDIVLISSLIIKGKEKLLVSCYHCDDLKLLDLQTSGWSTAFKGCYPWSSCPGGSGTIFVQRGGDNSILQLDATSSVFKGPVRTLHPNIPCSAMCYIRPPVNALVIGLGSSRMVALSVKKDEVIWEYEKDLVDFLFYPKYDVLLISSGKEDTLSVLNPENGNLIATLPVPYTPREDRDYSVLLCLLNNETFAMLDGSAKETEIYRIQLS